MFQARYTLCGEQGSFFTRKLEAVLRYMELPYDWIIKNPDRPSTLEARAGTRMIPLLVTPENWVLWDSTPIARLLDARYPERRILPTGPAQRIACLIFEDWFDEWFTRAAHYYRWAFPENADFMVRHAIARARFDSPLEDLREDETAEIDQIFAEIGPPLIRRMHEEVGTRVGASARTGADIPVWFEEFILNLDAHLDEHPYLLGHRPCIADFAVVGASIAHFVADPGPRAMIEASAPNVAEYVRRGWDAVACDEDWLDEDRIPESWTPFFIEMEARYLRYLRANRQAIADEKETVTLDLGHGEVRVMAVPYREQSRLDIRDEILRLDEGGRRRVREAIPQRVLETYELPALTELGPANAGGLFPDRDAG